MDFLSGMCKPTQTMPNKDSLAIHLFVFILGLTSMPVHSLGSRVRRTEATRVVTVSNSESNHTTYLEF